MSKVNSDINSNKRGRGRPRKTDSNKVRVGKVVKEKPKQPKLSDVRRPFDIEMENRRKYGRVSTSYPPKGTYIKTKLPATHMDIDIELSKAAEKLNLKPNKCNIDQSNIVRFNFPPAHFVNHCENGVQSQEESKIRRSKFAKYRLSYSSMTAKQFIEESYNTDIRWTDDITQPSTQ